MTLQTSRRARVSGLNKWALNLSFPGAYPGIVPDRCVGLRDETVALTPQGAFRSGWGRGLRGEKAQEHSTRRNGSRTSLLAIDALTALFCGGFHTRTVDQTMLRTKLSRGPNYIEDQTISRTKLCRGPRYVEDQTMSRTKLCRGPNYVEDQTMSRGRVLELEKNIKIF